MQVSIQEFKPHICPVMSIMRMNDLTAYRSGVIFDPF
jgi:hypothetical protein